MNTDDIEHDLENPNTSSPSVVKTGARASSFGFLILAAFAGFVVWRKFIRNK